jgi:hypothetical protein
MIALDHKNRPYTNRQESDGSNPISNNHAHFAKREKKTKMHTHKNRPLLLLAHTYRYKIKGWQTTWPMQFLTTSRQHINSPVGYADQPHVQLSACRPPQIHFVSIYKYNTCAFIYNIYAWFVVVVHITIYSLLYVRASLLPRLCCFFILHNFLSVWFNRLCVCVAVCASCWLPFAAGFVIPLKIVRTITYPGFPYCTLLFQKCTHGTVCLINNLRKWCVSIYWMLSWILLYVWEF